MSSSSFALAAGILLSIASGLQPQTQPASQQLPPVRNAVAGTVTDEAGTPVEGVVVTLVERDVRSGITRFHPANVQLLARTDVRGQYRIEGVRLGECYVVAIPRNAQVGADGRPNRVGHAVTYHPSVRRASEAAPVTINIRETQVADIRLLPAPLAVVSGTVFTSDGRPAQGGRLRIARGDNLFGVATSAAELRQDGRFALGGLSPGTYFLHLSEGPWPPPRTVETPLISGATVVVDGTDLTGVRVVPIQMVRAAGRVNVDPSAPADLEPSAITISASPINFEGNPGPSRPGTLKDDLTFEFRTWPARGWVRVLGLEGSGWSVAGVRHRGIDVTQTGVDFKEGEVLSGIEIDLRRHK